MISSAIAASLVSAPALRIAFRAGWARNGRGAASMQTRFIDPPVTRRPTPAAHRHSKALW